MTMEPSAPYKKATAVLDEAARARLRGPFFGGTAPPLSGHEDADDGLVELVDEFYNGYGEDATGGSGYGEEATAPRPAARTDTLREALADAAADAAAAKIRAVAERAVLDAGPSVAGAGAGGIVKRVAEQLRARGFDAGLCRSSWERSGSVPAGSHEYVDVVFAAPAGSASSTSRYIVDVNFAAEFEIARPSAEYQEILLSLPPVLVATPEAFKAVAAAMCAAAEASIRGAGMHVPPWRRARYVQAKWSGLYKRVAVEVPKLTVTASPPAAPRRRSAPSGRRNHCGMEMGRREMPMARVGFFECID